MDWSIEKSTFVLTDLSYLLSITIISDNIVESNESFSLILDPHDPRPGFKPTGGETVITILDNNCMYGRVLLLIFSYILHVYSCRCYTEL